MFAALRTLFLIVTGIVVITRILARLERIERALGSVTASPSPVNDTGAAAQSAPAPAGEVHDNHPAPAEVPVAEGPAYGAPERLTVVSEPAPAVRDVEADARAVLAQLNAALSEPAAADATTLPSEVVVVDDSECLHGSFTVSGVAEGPRQVVIGSVRFPRPLWAAPSGWRLGGPTSPLGVIVVDLDRSENCEASAFGVVQVAGYEPTVEGFSVRVLCVAAGAYSVTGRFRINEG